MIDIVFIAGSGRSGTTLLERMLGQIYPFVTIGELRHLWRGDYSSDLCGCGKAFYSCPFWQPIMLEILGEDDVINFEKILTLRNQVDRIRYLPYILLKRYPNHYRKKYIQYSAIIQQIYHKINQADNKSKIVDSSKDISSLYLLTNFSDIKLHVIHMVRDSRAVAYSRQRKRVNPQFVNQTKHLAIYSPRKAAFDWIYRNLSIEIGKKYFENYTFIRYEDLVNDPLTEMERVCVSLGLSKPDLSFIRKSEIHLSRIAHTVSGNPMRFQTGRLELKLDVAWRVKMKKRDKKIVTGLTWPLLKHYHYDIRS